MWISNVATAAMIFPTAIAVIDQLQANLDEEKKGKNPNASEKQPLVSETALGSSDDEKITLEIETTQDISLKL